MQNKQFLGRNKPLKPIWSESTKTSILSHLENDNALVGGRGGILKCSKVILRSKYTCIALNHFPLNYKK